MKRLADYVGRMIKVRPRLLSEVQARSPGPPVENRFLVVSIHRRGNRLVCYGGRYRLLLKAEDVCVI